jgi:hypothetical protein
MRRFVRERVRTQVTCPMTDGGQHGQAWSTRLKSLFSQKPRDPSPLCVKTQEHRITKKIIFNN